MGMENGDKRELKKKNLPSRRGKLLNWVWREDHLMLCSQAVN